MSTSAAGFFPDLLAFFFLNFFLYDIISFLEKPQETSLNQSLDEEMFFLLEFSQQKLSYVSDIVTDFFCLFV